MADETPTAAAEENNPTTTEQPAPETAAAAQASVSEEAAQPVVATPVQASQPTEVGTPPEPRSPADDTDILPANTSAADDKENAGGQLRRGTSAAAQTDEERVYGRNLRAALRADEDDSASDVSSGIFTRAENRERAFFDRNNTSGDPFDIPKRSLVFAAEDQVRIDRMLRSEGHDFDLRTYLAYHQLNELEGLHRVCFSKLEEQLEAQKELFRRRVAQMDTAFLRRVFAAYRAACAERLRKYRRARRAIQRMLRGKLAKAFFHWQKLHENVTVEERMVMGMQRPGGHHDWHLKHQSFKAWMRVAMAVRNHVLRIARDAQVKARERMHFQKKFVDRRNRRLQQMVWDILYIPYAEYKEKLKKAARHFLQPNRVRRPAWNSWWHQVTRKRLAKRCMARMLFRQQARAWNQWYEVFIRAKKVKYIADGAVRRIIFRTQSLCWEAWQQNVFEIKRKRGLVKNMILRMQRKKFWVAFNTWNEYVYQTKMHRRLLKPVVKRWEVAYLRDFYDCWVAFAKVDRKTLRNQIERLTNENERLRRDNERYMRLIDSGEWGRGRVAELAEAGEVLRAERATLTQLIGQLQVELAGVQQVREKGASEVDTLKRRMLGGDFKSRNRMLIKAGSTANGLKRMLKGELIDQGVGGMKREKSLRAEVDELSMENVTLLPDEEDLHVHAVRSRGITFDRQLPRAGLQAGDVRGKTATEGFVGASDRMAYEGRSQLPVPGGYRGRRVASASTSREAGELPSDKLERLRRMYRETAGAAEVAGGSAAGSRGAYQRL